jgi:hypothetical protein
MELMRKCKRCREIKPLTPEYYLKEKDCKGGFRPICKECKYGKSGAIPRKAQKGYKICTRCEEEKPLSLEFWVRTNSTKDGFHTICKACKNKTDKTLITWNREGFKICTECGIEKPLTSDYFIKNKNVSYGFSSPCRACKNKIYKKVKIDCRICRREYDFNDINFIKNDYFKGGLSDVCINCVKLEKMKEVNPPTKDNKMCKYCLNEYPETAEFFFKRGTKFDVSCKECRGYTFGIKQKVLNRKKVDGYKYCTLCSKLFPLSTKHFYRNPISEDGFGSSCKTCLKDKEKGKGKLYLDSVRNRKRINQQCRNSRKNNLPYDYSDCDWESCKTVFDYKCCYCGEPSDKLQQEHFVPVSKGGGYVRENILPACPRCNISKKNKDFLTWYKKQDFYDKDRALKIIKYLKSQKHK